jgi:hypothetical protein
MRNGDGDGAAPSLAHDGVGAKEVIGIPDDPPTAAADRNNVAMTVADVTNLRNDLVEFSLPSTPQQCPLLPNGQSSSGHDGNDTLEPNIEQLSLPPSDSSGCLVTSKVAQPQLSLRERSSDMVDSAASLANENGDD